MSHRIVQGRPGRVRRRTLTGHVLGLSPDTTIDGLKQYLHAATLTSSPTEKLDLVLLDDLAHFAELIAQDGIPLARADALEPPLEPLRHRVKLEIHVGWIVATLAFLAVNFLDDLIAVITGFDPIPWF